MMGNWELEIGNWGLEIGNWKLGIGPIALTATIRTEIRSCQVDRPQDSSWGGELTHKNHR
ncbi:MULTISPECIES: hypothetical protein [unclassified Microcoleus]|uniref:hypothetical protein n=1 Tax=unclassified Microcoleus TaxID=2642155 RepID=UPI002FD67D94